MREDDVLCLYRVVANDEDLTPVGGRLFEDFVAADRLARKEGGAVLCERYLLQLRWLSRGDYRERRA